MYVNLLLLPKEAKKRNYNFIWDVEKGTTRPTKFSIEEDHML